MLRLMAPHQPRSRWGGGDGRLVFAISRLGAAQGTIPEDEDGSMKKDDLKQTLLN